MALGSIFSGRSPRHGARCAGRAGPFRALHCLAVIAWLGSGGLAAAESTADQPAAAVSAADESTAPGARQVARVEALWRAGDRAAAHALVDSALPFARLAADTTTTGHLLILRGVMHTAMGDGPRGEAPLREGLQLVQTRGEARWELTALRWLGVALGQNLKDAEAREVFGTLLARSTEFGDRNQQAWAETGLAYQDQRRGDVESARNRYDRAGDLFRSGGDLRGELFALNGLGNTLNELSDFDAARRCYVQTLVASHRLGSAFLEAIAENNLGTLEYNLGDPGVALAHFRRAHAIEVREDNLREAINTARSISICLIHLGDYDRSLDLLDSALQTCRERDYRELQYSALTEKGIVLSMLGRPSEAAAIHEELLAWPDPMPDRRVLEMVLSYAVVLDQLARPAEGVALLRQYEDRARDLDDPVVRLAYLTRLGVLLNRSGRPRPALAVLLSADAQAASLQLNDSRLAGLPAAGAACRALDLPDSALVFYRRAAELWERERGVPLDPEWRERRGIAGQAIYTELADLIMTEAERDGQPADSRRQAYELLQAFKARTLLERMRGPQASPATTLPPAAAPTTLADVQASLNADGEVLLDFFVGRDRGFLFVVTRHSLQTVPLPPVADLAARIGLFRDLITLPLQGSPPPAAGRDLLLESGAAVLWDLLLAPAAETLAQCSRVVYCPDGDLNRLPLELVLAAGTPETAGRTRHGKELERVPSASIFCALRDSRPGASPPIRQLLAVTGAGGGGGRDLAAATREVRWLDTRFAGVSLGLPDSSVGAAGLAAFDLIHFASHARVSADFPWRSTIEARTAAGHGQLLGAGEIVRTSIQARLTVLAGCESAGGQVIDGEGVMGLSSAFIAAGSPTVVASLWPVDDEATFVLMRQLYTGLERGLTVSHALAEARSILAREPRFADPCFGAGFVVIGDGDRSFVLTRRRRPAGWQVLLAGGIMLLLGAAAAARQQARQKKTCDL